MRRSYAKNSMKNCLSDIDKKGRIQYMPAYYSISILCERADIGALKVIHARKLQNGIKIFWKKFKIRIYRASQLN